MPNLRDIGMSDTVRAFHMVGSDNRTLTLTKAQLRTFYLTTSGSAAARRTAVVAWIRQPITDALGAEIIDAARVDLDFTPADGGLTRFEVLG